MQLEVPYYLNALNSNNVVSIVDCFGIFYILEELRAEAGMWKSYTHSAERLRADINKAYNDWTEELGRGIRDYLLISAFAEARHGASSCSHYIPNIDRSDGRSGAWKKAAQHNPETLYAPLIALFRNREWSSAYGGKKWGHIAATAAQYGKMIPGVFIDHVVDISHNGGCAFNKGIIFESIDGPLSAIYRNFLDSKAQKSPIYHCIHKYRLIVSSTVRELLNRSHRLGLLSDPPPACIVVDFEIPKVQWGSKTFNCTIIPSSTTQSSKSEKMLSFEAFGTKEFLADHAYQMTVASEELANKLNGLNKSANIAAPLKTALTGTNSKAAMEEITHPGSIHAR
jgi:hypothetical protein